MNSVDIALPSSGSPIEQETCGIHDINTNTRFNPSQPLLASGAENPTEIAIFSLPSFKPLIILQGQRDWTFASRFLSENLLVSGSRDSSIYLWSTISEEQENIQQKTPLLVRKEHKRKVRSIEYNSTTKQMMSLSADCSMKVWDIHNFDVVTTVTLKERSELVCMSIDELTNVAVVGSQYRAEVIDVRIPNPTVRLIKSNDSDWGVRSVSLMGHVLTMGGGMGRISFYDLRANGFIPLPQSSNGIFLKTGVGWESANDSYYYVGGTVLPHACYTHCYDPSGTRLFVAGGPLIAGMKGSYASVW